MHGIDPIALGIVVMFGSILVGAGVGAIVGRFTKFELGVAVAMLSLAAGGLGSAAWLAWHFHIDTIVVELARSGCKDLSSQNRGRPYSAERYLLLTHEGREVTLDLPPEYRTCSNDDDQRPLRPVRYRPADLRETQAMALPARPADDPKQPYAGPLVLTAFGTFGLLAGLFMLAQWRTDRRIARHGPDRRPAVSATRERWSGRCNLAANVGVFGCVIAVAFADLSAEDSTVLAFATVPIACVLYALAFALKGRLSIETALILLIIGSGFAAAGWSLAVLG